MLYCVRGLTEAWLEDIYSSSLAHGCSHSILEGPQVAEAGLALGAATLAVPNLLPVPHVPQHRSQEDLLHELPRHGGEAGRSAVPRVLLLTF